MLCDEIYISLLLGIFVYEHIFRPVENSLIHLSTNIKNATVKDYRYANDCEMDL